MAIKGRSSLMSFPRVGKFIIIFFALAFIVAGLRGYQLYMYVFKDNAKKHYILLVHENTTFDALVDSLNKNDVLQNYKAFRWVAKKKSYPSRVKPGRYLIEDGMSSNEIVNMLRSGLQEPVNVTFSNIHFKEDLAGRVSRYIQADSLSILALFSDEERIEKYGFTPETFRSMFIPNTYEFYWTTTANEFADRMKEEFDRFWNQERMQKAEAINLTPAEVTTLASIVQAETAKGDEMPAVAGLYVNRLRIGMPLQADPTVKYAVGDFSLRRILTPWLRCRGVVQTVGQG